MSGGVSTILGAGNDTWPIAPVVNTGNDSVDGAGGDDLINGGSGNDTLVGGSGNDALLGGIGNDSLVDLSGGFDDLIGEEGDDTLVGFGGSQELVGGGGHDSIFGGTQVAPFLRISGRDGNDTMVSGGGADTIVAGTGDDSVNAGDGANSILGEDGSDTLIAGGGLDSINAGIGDDIVNAGDGADTILGGDGNDTLIAGGGLDSINAGTGNDTIEGGLGNDTLQGGLGDDLMDGGDGNDFVLYADAASGVDVRLNSLGGGNPGGGAAGDGLSNFEGVIGSTFDDTLIGNSAANTLMGGNGADSLSGGGGNDWLDYGDGIDRFDFAAGVTTGNLTLIGGGGQDTLNLGSDWVGNAVGSFTSWTQDGGSQTLYSQGWDSIVCFAEGTRIVTPNGEDAVENLRAGDMVLAMRDGQAGFEPLRWVGFMDVAVPRNATMAAKTAPILIKAGAIAPGMPARDLRVSPDHAMEVDGHLIPAKHLVNGSSIIQEIWCKRVRYFHLELEAHGLLLSEGTWSESYLDDDNRHAFNNAALTGLFLDFEAGRSKGQYDHRACLPVLRQGLKLDEIHGRLALRAEELARGAKVLRHG
jgi:hypothetical protein